MLKVCLACGTRCAHTLTACPHCRATELRLAHEVTEDTMPKITSRGPSIAGLPGPATATTVHLRSAPQAAAQSPLTAAERREIRAWARSAGFEVPARGSIPPHIVAAYDESRA